MIYLMTQLLAQRFIFLGCEENENPQKKWIYDGSQSIVLEVSRHLFISYSMR